MSFVTQICFSVEELDDMIWVWKIIMYIVNVPWLCMVVIGLQYHDRFGEFID